MLERFFPIRTHNQFPKVTAALVYFFTNVAVTELQILLGIRSLDLTSWPDLRWPGPYFFSGKSAETWLNSYTKNGGR